MNKSSWSEIAEDQTFYQTSDEFVKLVCASNPREDLVPWNFMYSWDYKRCFDHHSMHLTLLMENRRAYSHIPLLYLWRSVGILWLLSIYYCECVPLSLSLYSIDLIWGNTVIWSAMTGQSRQGWITDENHRNICHPVTRLIFCWYMNTPYDLFNKQ